MAQQGSMPTVRLVLASAPRPLCRVAGVTAVEVCAWFAERVPMVVPETALPVLDRWEAELRREASPLFPGWTPDGPGRSPAEAAPLIGFLREHARRGEPLTFNALHVERQGGRAYPFWIEGYRGPLTISENKYAEAGKRGPRLLLSAIRRDVRALLQAPPGGVLVELDFRSCHPGLALALSGDPQLAIDLDGDIHQAIGDAVAPSLPQGRRRDLGKRLNLRMLFGATPRAVAELAEEELGRAPADRTGHAVWSAWWSRYPRLAAFRDEVRGLVHQAQAARCAMEIESPSGSVSRFAPAEVQGRVGKGRGAPGSEDLWRTIWSAAFRAVEGDLLNLVLRNFHAKSAGGGPVLPLYDGLLAAAPSGSVDEVERALLDSAAEAVRTIGIPKLKPEIKRR